ncbi:sigma-70 family RNA polymerase sigma factor [Pimelobacter simplex]|uniref:Putative RNA polymerase ECF-subfamily sigma factor n=1 Tax=Nocardioides simplex TaxID=2045 RepID=A0A0A1DU25_NOCSI|nr:sigma-70 family RNA polymerase sigma factor [Pimelobacter simplex]AIY20033.2 putative RNA polymerase ECF-subfamily sigma factor [Pimelobacter simplex]MCG8153406.1 sigma-70 family RNA polymerase sigma factor [Pimelobacter simplex]GEB15923.1 DNA-directed RNA polymerase sigma-70 factor [Pimelobacter simplex]SFN12821.1 RNA polymerase sigma-70 factor, ECF subfamily [Pimelobacter simplex]
MARILTAGEFEELYRATAPELFGYVRRRTTADAEDVVAEVFTTAWRRRGDLPAPMLRRAWLYGVARRLLLAEARRQGREDATVTELASRPEQAPADAGEARRQAVRAALDRLSPAEREVLLLVEWERLTPAELAVTLGVRPGTARVRLHRARRALAADPELDALARALRAGSRA